MQFEISPLRVRKCAILRRIGDLSFTDTNEHKNAGLSPRPEGDVAFVYESDRASWIKRIGVENLLILFATRAAHCLIAGLG